MKKNPSHDDQPRTCIVPGCGKTLPSDAKRPICDWHWDLAKEQRDKIGGGILAVVGGVIVFVKKDGMKIIGEAWRRFRK